MKKKNYLLMFFTITLLWTWVIGFVPIIFGMQNTVIGDSLFKILVGPAPSIIGLIMVFATYSKEQRKGYIRRCFNIKQLGLIFPILLIALYIFVCLLTIFISTNFLGGSVPEFAGLKSVLSQPLTIFIYLFFALISGPLNEEFGWRGYSLDHLFEKYSFVKASLILGFIWGMWHLPWYFYPSNGQYIAWSISPIHGMYFIVNSMTTSLLVSICYVKKNRSVIAGALVHLLSNFLVGGTLIYPFDNTYIIISMYVASILELVVSIIIINRKKFKAQFTKIKENIKDEFKNY